MKKTGIALVLATILLGCSPGLTSQGNSLNKIKEGKAAAAGKTYALTLEQINIERDKQGLYLRAFDGNHNTIFLYFGPRLKNKVHNLTRGKDYIYKFKYEKYDKYRTLSGTLLEIAATNGQPVSGARKDSTPSAKSVILDAADARGKTYTIPLVYRRTAEDDGRNYAYFQSPDDYRFGVTCYFGKDLEKAVGKLEAEKQYTVTLKVTKTDWRIFADLQAIK